MAFRKNNFEATPLSGVKRIESKEKKLLSSSSKYLEHKDNKNKIQRNNIQRKATKNQKKAENNVSNINGKLKVIPLGGLGEIGKNLTVFETEEDIILVDCGLKFPDENMYGIDIVIPEFTYLIEKRNKIRGLFLTHGHEDHIGAIPYLLKQINIPIYGTKLTMGLLKNKLVEHKLDESTKLHIVKRGHTVHVKGFSVEFVTSNHSIPDSCALYITSPYGKVFHTGDFKVDYTPVDNQQINLQRMAAIGAQGVDLLIADSTNAEREGATKSEASVGRTFMSLFKEGIDKRIIVATFATNVHRVQQIFDAAKKFKRKVAISGRSMVNVISVAKELKYLKFNDNIMIELNEVDNYPPERVVILTTGSQGEPMAALSRMANGEHRQFKISNEDFVIISATPIPGNEKTVAEVINSLFELGAEVVYQGAEGIHVSGHAQKEELKLMHSIIKAKYFMPAHGEYKMLSKHKELAMELGMKEENIFVMKNGDILEIGPEKAKIKGEVPNGMTLIDGLGIGDVGNIVLKDRKKLSEDGLFIVVVSLTKERVVSGPGIVSRGFVYMRESEELLNGAKEIANKVLDKYKDRLFDYNSIKADMKYDLEKYLYDSTKRRPMILPILMYVRVD
ncbi:ribonuclease J [Anaerofustis sp. NSJ-163]|uniref:ribonuclease J n=1 Tax=Anaerofustis sp. NSJ-163 TaxID=2944391 RepID=UPI00209BDE4D|nr:ribonuclease J [Anaerofustis sp. NSJ-163]MCO8193083.1 ribonuclease J [Anaerofustis sp. NSJ-163]